MSDANDLRELEKDPRLFLYTSLTAGSSHIITATSRLETILKANKVPFQAIDVATDEKHKKLWQRRAGKRKLPGLVKDGFVIGDLEEVEEWNEYGELKENIGTVPAVGTGVPAPKLPVIPTATAGTTKVTAPDPLLSMPKRVALPGAAEIAARNNPLPKSSPEAAAHSETMSTAPADKEVSIKRAIKFKGEEKHIEHLSAPASAIPSTTPTPTPETIDAREKTNHEDGATAVAALPGIPTADVAKGKAGPVETVTAGESDATRPVDKETVDASKPAVATPTSDPTATKEQSTLGGAAEEEATLPVENEKPEPVATTSVKDKQPVSVVTSHVKDEKSAPVVTPKVDDTMQAQVTNTQPISAKIDLPERTIPKADEEHSGQAVAGAEKPGTSATDSALQSELKSTSGKTKPESKTDADGEEDLPLPPQSTLSANVAASKEKDLPPPPSSTVADVASAHSATDEVKTAIAKPVDEDRPETSKHATLTAAPIPDTDLKSTALIEDEDEDKSKPVKPATDASPTIPVGGDKAAIVGGRDDVHGSPKTLEQTGDAASAKAGAEIGDDRPVTQKQAAAEPDDATKTVGD